MTSTTYFSSSWNTEKTINHLCDVPNCGNHTSSVPVPDSEMHQAYMCFPQMAPSSLKSSHKTASYLCFDHRTILQQYKQAVLTHAEQISSWNDDDEHYQLINKTHVNNQHVGHSSYQSFNQSNQQDEIVMTFAPQDPSAGSIKQLSMYPYNETSEIPVIKHIVKAGWVISFVMTAVLFGWSVVGAIQSR